jgi:uncharacterized membrane protein YsdA (DUF1294 family)
MTITGIMLLLMAVLAGVVSAGMGMLAEEHNDGKYSFFAFLSILVSVLLAATAGRML